MTPLSEMKVTAELTHAVLQPLEDGGTIAKGVILGDIHQRWRDGTVIWTSRIMEGPDPNGLIRTRNSVYKLADWVQA